MGNEITGYFISFNNDELADIRRRLELFGYTADSDGLKQLITDTLCNMEEGGEIEESATDRLIKSATDYVSNNPQTILMGIKAIKNVAGMLKRKKS